MIKNHIFIQLTGCVRSTALHLSSRDLGRGWTRQELRLEAHELVCSKLRDFVQRRPGEGLKLSLVLPYTLGASHGYVFAECGIAHAERAAELAKFRRLEHGFGLAISRLMRRSHRFFLAKRPLSR
jgi:hypothetical protein